MKWYITDGWNTSGSANPMIEVTNVTRFRGKMVRFLSGGKIGFAPDYCIYSMPDTKSKTFATVCPLWQNI